MATTCGFEAPAIEPLPFEELLGEPADSQADHCSDSPSVIVLLQPQEITDPCDLHALQSDDDDDGFVEDTDLANNLSAGNSSYISPCRRFKRELRMEVNERLLSSSEEEDEEEAAVETCRCKLIDFYHLTKRHRWRHSKGELQRWRHQWWQ
ncbi:hypothetical protein NP493_112g02007 [Ridgeia piscesae]|uniref:Uncharacterized protein n=1 Tax=Ridgeia piscesae TaxID=27915 RepID=A0AAD9P6W4_RIDPI|nr:hypothetical protein NP493_112g02007 [Ridgeia piscesae]